MGKCSPVVHDAKGVVSLIAWYPFMPHQAVGITRFNMMYELLQVMVKATLWER